MHGKEICPACGQLVDCTALTFREGCNVVADDSLPHEQRLKLTVRHPAVPGHKATHVVSEQTGEVIETMCDGSLRPVKEIVMH